MTRAARQKVPRRQTVEKSDAIAPANREWIGTLDEMPLREWYFSPIFPDTHSEVSPYWITKLVVLPIVLFAVARWLRRTLRQRLQDREGIDSGVAYALTQIGYYAILVVGSYAILENAGINLLGFAAFAGALGVGIGIGLQNVAKNFVSGMILLVSRPIRPGDRIEINQISGDVTSIGMNHTVLQSPEDATVIVPNSMLLEQPLINWTLRDNRRMVTTDVPAPRTIEAEAMRDLLVSIVKTVPGVLPDPPPEARLVSLGDQNLTFRIVAWTTEFIVLPNKLISAINFAIYRAYADQGHEISVPNTIAVAPGPAKK